MVIIASTAARRVATLGSSRHVINVATLGSSRHVINVATLGSSRHVINVATRRDPPPKIGKNMIS